MSYDPTTFRRQCNWLLIEAESNKKGHHRIKKLLSVQQKQILGSVRDIEKAFVFKKYQQSPNHMQDKNEIILCV